MPIKIKTDLEFGQSWYIRSDPDQFEHKLVGVVVVPGNVIKLRLSYMGDVVELFDFECSLESSHIENSEPEDES